MAQARLHWMMREDRATMKLWGFWRVQNLGRTKTPRTAGCSLWSLTTSSNKQPLHSQILMPLCITWGIKFAPLHVEQLSCWCYLWSNPCENAKSWWVSWSSLCWIIYVSTRDYTLWVSLWEFPLRPFCWPQMESSCCFLAHYSSSLGRLQLSLVERIPATNVQVGNLQRRLGRMHDVIWL